MNRAAILDRMGRAIPAKYLRPIALPIGHHLQAEDTFRFETVRMLNTAFGYTTNEKISGDYAEFGVLEGRSFLEAWLAIQRWGLPARMHAYDSFAGLPEPTGVDAGGPFTAGEFVGSRAIFDEATDAIPDGRMTVTAGFYDQSLASAEKHQLAVAFIDCDLYESTVPVLDFITDQVQDGTVLMFDDWFCFHARSDKGQQLAVSQWLEANPWLTLVPFRDFSWSGRSFIVNR